MESLTVHELTLVDHNGRPTIRLSARSSAPALQLIGSDGKVALSVELDPTNHPSVKLQNPGIGSSASLSVDSKGAHVKFDNPGGASSYLFLNDQGGSGIVLLDNTGRRRYELLLNADGTIITGHGDDGGNSTH